MFPLLGSQLQFYQKKSYKLQMQVITLQDELLSLKTSKGDEYKIKYQMLLDKLAEENQLKQGKRNEAFLQQEKTINELNDKWESVLNEKVNEFKMQVEVLTLQKSSLKNKAIEVELKCIKLQKQIDDGDSQVLAIKLESIKKDNQRLKKDNNQLYRSREESISKIQRECQIKIQSIKEREKTFYRDQIEALQKNIEQNEAILQSQRQKISPERENLIHSLKEEIASLKHSQDLQIQRLTALLEKRSKQLKKLNDQTEIKEKSNFQIVSDLTNQLKVLEQKLFKFEYDKSMEIKVIQHQMSHIRQKEADDLKRQLQKMKGQFDQERQQWKKIIEQAQNSGKAEKKAVQEQKEKFLEEKKRLKTKIAELKIRLKERQEQKGNGQTEMLIKSLREMNNNQAHFNNYEDAITFMDRQVRKATMKIQEKNRQINNLLEQLKTLQSQTQSEVKQVKEKSKNEQKKLYDKLFILEEQFDELQQRLREKQKYIKKKQVDLQEQKEGHKIEIENLKKIIQQMQRDYKRLTGNKKNVEDSYREQRQNVISGKLDINQQKKKKWNQLIRQRNQLQIVYREREMQLKGEYEMQIDKLKREKQRLIEEKEEYRADAELLRERLNESNDQNKENKMVDYQKKLATLDLQIALTQNLFSTLSNATSKKQTKPRSELQELSQGRSSSHSFQLKASDVMTPLFMGNDSHKQDVFKGAMFSFTPFNSNK